MNMARWLSAALVLPRRVRIIFAVVVAGACTAPVATAAPLGFPDLSGFTDVSKAFIQHGGRGTVGVKFATPDGLSCGFPTPAQVAPGNQLVKCNGPLPDLDPDLGEASDDPGAKCDLGYAQAPSSGLGAVSHSRGACPSGKPDLPVLNPGQKVTYGNITCGVAAGEVTACINTSNGEHGFVLRPTGSWAF